jgi:hypothetical protein
MENVYSRLLSRMLRLSIDGDMAPDVRRTALNICQSMLVAAKSPRKAAPWPSANLYGAMAQQMWDAERAAIEEERQDAMRAAMDRATSFLAGWASR